MALQGGCLCGAVRFELSEAPSSAGYCHCTRCQRRTGSGASAQAGVDGASFRLLQGEESLGGWRHPDGGFDKRFCRECGAHLFSHNEDWSRLSVRMSAFDPGALPPGLRPSFRQYVAYAAPWEPIPDDGLPRYDEARPQATETVPPPSAPGGV